MNEGSSLQNDDSFCLEFSGSSFNGLTGFDHELESSVHARMYVLDVASSEINHEGLLVNTLLFLLLLRSVSQMMLT